MSRHRNRWSILPVGLRRKVLISFCLMSIIPLLVAALMATNYVFSEELASSNLFSKSTVLFAALVVALLGFLFIRGIVDPIVKMSLDARRIASGDVDKVVEVETEDEVGDLGTAVNEMGSRIRKNINELTRYSEDVERINNEIHKKVSALSSVLQITTLMSSTDELNVVLSLVMDKVGLISGGTRSILLMKKDGEVFFPHIWRGGDVNPELGLDRMMFREFLSRMEKKRELVVWDADRRKNLIAERLLLEYGLLSGVLVPLVYMSRLNGVLVIGSAGADCVFPPSDLEVIRIFQKQIGIALESDHLVKRNKELSIRDEVTGLYNERFLRERLNEEVRRAILFQRPCSYVLFSMEQLGEYENKCSKDVIQNLLKRIGQVMLENVDDISKVGRSGHEYFAIILPEKNKGEALQLAELIKKKVERARFQGLHDIRGHGVQLSAGVSSNPLDGMTGDELIDQAIASLLKARHCGQGRSATKGASE